MAEVLATGANQQPERYGPRLEVGRAELVERIGQALPIDGVVEPLAGLQLIRVSQLGEMVHNLFEPSFCIIAQGSKEILIGSSRYRYDPANYLIVTLGLPYVSQLLEASPDRPFLGLRLVLPPALVGAVIVEAGQAPAFGPGKDLAIAVSRLDADLMDAAVRLVRLLETPAQAPVLLPLITREIIYRLLIGEQGVRLQQMAVVGGYTPHIARAVERLQHDFDQPVRIEQMARELGMSTSSFHHQFKAVTDMSPLQYQKQLRLQEARRLMLGDGLDAASAAYRVGYNDASHFNREYKSLFGRPPMRDVQQLREIAAAGAS